MFKMVRTFLPAAAALTLTFTGAAQANQNEWERIDVPTEEYTVQVTGQDGIPKNRQIAPGCALPGGFDEGGPIPNDYSFYFKQGNSDKLLVFFNGGGACWDKNTCVDSIFGKFPGVPPAYVPTDEIAHNYPKEQRGIFNTEQKENPFKNWSMVFLPYCTGDVHAGSKDVSYAGFPVPVRHRGFDNFLYARDWLQKRFADEGQTPPGKIAVTGSSAGAYGALLNYPYVMDAFPQAKGVLVADSGVGMLPESFLDNAFIGPDSSWNAADNLALWVPGLSNASGLGNQFLPAVYAALTAYYPDHRFGQFTTAWDAVQVLFLSIMNNTSSPETWISELGNNILPWHLGMRNLVPAPAFAANYRSFIAPGCTHTMLRSDEGFYSTTTVYNSTVLDWVTGLVRDKRGFDALASPSCLDDWTCPAPEPEEFGACIQ